MALGRSPIPNREFGRWLFVLHGIPVRVWCEDSRLKRELLVCTRRESLPVRLIAI